MAETKEVLESLRSAQAWFESQCDCRESDMADAVAVIERQQAEIERLAPRSMTLEECCEVFNREEYLYSIRPAGDESWHVSRDVAFNGFDSYTLWEANVLANALLRDKKEAANG